MISFRIDWFDLLVVQGEPSPSQESSPTPQFESIKCFVFFFLAGCTFYFVNDLCISSHTTLLGHPGTFGILNLRHFESRNVHGEEDTERCVAGNVEGGTGEPERAAGVPSPGCRRRAVRSLSV